MPKINVNNPFYSGYYPGGPFVRPPRNYVPRPTEYTPNDFDNYMTMMEDEFTNLLNAPKDWFIYDTKQAVSTFAMTNSYSAEDFRAYADEGDLPGVASVTIKLDPVDWATDPLGQLKKTGEDWAKNVFKWSDLLLQTERDRLWKPLLDGNEKQPIGFGAVVGTLGTGVVLSDLQGGPADRTPLQLRGLGVKKIEKRRFYDAATDSVKEIDYAVDIYDDVANKFEKFVDDRGFAPNRMKSYGAFQQSMVEAVCAEFENDLVYETTASGAIKLDANNNPIVRVTSSENISHYAGLNMMDTADVEFARQMDAFRDRAAAGKSMEGVSKSMSKVSKELDKFGLGHGDVGKLQETLQAHQEAVKAAEDAIAQVRTHAAQMHIDTKGFDNAIAQFEDVLAQSRVRLVDGSGTLSSAAQRLVSGGGDVIFSSDLKTQVDIMSKSLNGRALFGNGALDNYRDYLTDAHFLGKHSQKSVLVRALEERTVGGRAVRRWMAIGSGYHDRAEIQDLVQNVDGGRFFRQYVFVQKLQTRIKNFTPSRWIKENLNRLNWFGLNVSDDYVWDKTHEAHGIAKLTNSIYRDAKFFKNSFTLKIPELGIRFRAQGGDHFEAPLDLVRHLREGHFGDTAADPTTKVLAFSGANSAQNQKDFLEFINGKKTELIPIDAKDLTIQDARDKFDKYQKKVEKFKKWLQEHADELGLKFDPTTGDLITDGVVGAQNMERLALVMHKLGDANRFASITAKYAGVLQKISKILNKFQSGLFKKLTGVVAPIAYVRNMLAQGFTTVIMGAFTAATGGLGAIAVPLKFALQWTVDKALKLGENLFKAIFKADLTELDKFLNKTGQLVVKLTLFVVFFLGLASLPVILLMGVLLSSVSPHNPASVGVSIPAVADLPDFPGGTIPGNFLDFCAAIGPDDSAPHPSNCPSLIASSASSIVLGLQSGFWCYWNNQPSYPALFSDDIFAVNWFPCYRAGSPAGCTPVAGRTPPYLNWSTDLFWCTTLTMEACRLGGGPVDLTGLYNCVGQRNAFRGSVQTDTTAFPNGNRYLSAGTSDGDTIRRCVHSGDVIFMRSSSSECAHVGIVARTGGNFITTLEANNIVKSQTFAITSGGVGHPVIGFGLNSGCN